MNFTAMGPEARAKKAEEIGYRSIGADLPDGIALAEIVRTMPKEVQLISSETHSCNDLCRAFGSCKVRAIGVLRDVDQ